MNCWELLIAMACGKFKATSALFAGAKGSGGKGLKEKILDLAEALNKLATAKVLKKKVVFTNGCFDILHAGHVEYLEKARALGDLLIVGINSDESVRCIKGPGRPISPLEERCLVLAGLACVDMVVPFEEPDPLKLIRALQPHVLVKGADWPKEAIVGARLVQAAGGEVITIPLRPKISTTLIIERILERFGSPGSEAAPNPRGC